MVARTEPPPKKVLTEMLTSLDVVLLGLCKRIAKARAKGRSSGSSPVCNQGVVFGSKELPYALRGCPQADEEIHTLPGSGTGGLRDLGLGESEQELVVLLICVLSVFRLTLCSPFSK